MGDGWGRGWKVVLVVGLLAACVWLGWASLTGRLSWERVGPKPSPGRQTVLLLHGFNAPADDLVGLAKELSAELPETTFVVPAGPHPTGFRGRAWVPDFSAPSRDEYVVRLAAEIATSNGKLWKLIDSLRSSGVACEDLYLGGFSQGGRMSVEAALRAPDGCQLAGVIVMSGGGMKEAELPEEHGGPLRVLVAHGDQDPVVGMGVGVSLSRELSKRGHAVRWLQFRGQHQIPDAVREAVGSFLRGEEVGAPVP